MKGGRGHDQVEWLAWKVPVVEIGDDHFSMFEGRKLPTSDLGEVRTKLDGHERHSALRQWNGQLTGARTNLQDPAALI